MESILEKITLYDILGFFFPGSVFVMIILFGGMKEDTLKFMEQWGDNRAALYFAFVVVSYLAGVILSEVSKWVQSAFKGLFSLCKKKENSWLMKQLIKIGEKLADDSFLHYKDQVAEALVKAGMREDKEIIKEKIQRGEDKYYKKYIYGNIQASIDYNRIHSFASAYVMYRNSASAIFIGLLVLCLKFNTDSWVCVWGMLVGLLLVVRSYRFLIRRNRYALIWFIEKYVGGNNAS